MSLPPEARNGLPASCRLYGILDTGYVARDNAAAMAQQMVRGGVGILQLRAKGLSAEGVLELAEAIAPVCRSGGVPFILNDHPELVSASGADGVHVGQDDMPVAEVRKIVGPSAIVGLSTHSLQQACAAIACGPDYIGFGPLFPTPTKPDYPSIGLHDIPEVHRQVKLPIFCIGGIKLENLNAVTAAGARRVVIVSGILQAEDPAAYCRQCLERLQ